MPDKEEETEQRQEKFVARNWKKKTEKEVHKMAPQLRSKYLAYEEPPKEVADFQEVTRKKLLEKKKERINQGESADRREQIEEHMKHEKLIGQLKAAEASNRIRIMRLRYESNRAEEINHLISCQPNARNAVRLQALLPVKNPHKIGPDSLDKLSRGRCEALLEDGQGLLTKRT